jgi:hypothetical protein
MPAPVIVVIAPPPANYPDTILRPQARIKWSGGTGPTYDVLHEWDTANDFSTGNLIQVANNGISATTDNAVPTSDLGPAGTLWYYRAKVTDNDDSTTGTSAIRTLDFTDVILERRYLHLLGNVGVGIIPIDTPAAGWGPDPDPPGGGPDGFAIDARRYLHLLGNVGVGFDPTDTPAAGWGPDPDPAGGAPDGFTIDFRRYLYLLGNVDTTTPTPHIWYLFPTFGREGWEFKIVGYGFGDTQGTHTGTARLNALSVGIVSWVVVAEVGSGLEIDPAIDLANPIHQEVRATVPTGGVSGLVFVETDDV